MMPIDNPQLPWFQPIVRRDDNRTSASVPTTRVLRMNKIDNNDLLYIKGVPTAFHSLLIRIYSDCRPHIYRRETGASFMESVTVSVKLSRTKVDSSAITMSISLVSNEFLLVRMVHPLTKTACSWSQRRISDLARLAQNYGFAQNLRSAFHEIWARFTDQTNEGGCLLKSQAPKGIRRCPYITYMFYFISISPRRGF